MAAGYIHARNALWLTMFFKEKIEILERANKRLSDRIGHSNGKCTSIVNDTFVSLCIQSCRHKSHNLDLNGTQVTPFLPCYLTCYSQQMTRT